MEEERERAGGFENAWRFRDDNWETSQHLLNWHGKKCQALGEVVFGMHIKLIGIITNLAVRNHDHRAIFRSSHEQWNSGCSGVSSVKTMHFEFPHNYWGSSILFWYVPETVEFRKKKNNNNSSRWDNTVTFD